jgi:hypothetical protein
VTPDDILAAIGTLEAVAVEQGLGVAPGTAVAAAQRARIEAGRTPAVVA